MITRRREGRVSRRHRGQMQQEEKEEEDKVATPPFKMLSSQVISYMRTGFTFNWFLYPHPFVWTENGPGLLKSGWRMTMWHLNLILTLTHFGFLMGRNIEAYWSNWQKIGLEHSTTFYTLPTMFQITVLFWKQDFLKYVDESLARDNESQGRMSRVMDACNVFAMRVVFYVLNFAASWLIIEAYLNPQSPQFLSSLWPDAEFLDTKSRILFATAEAYLAYSNLSKTFLCLFGVGGLSRFLI